MSKKINKEKNIVTIFVISDSAGETAAKLVAASMAQYPTVDFLLYRRAFIDNEKKLIKALNEAKEKQALVLYTIVNHELVQFAKNFLTENNLYQLDLLTPLISKIESLTGHPPTREAGALHHLNENYFNRIEAMEFAVKYDDGKDPRGFLEADVLLLGISRTSKTPLSLFLANKNLKVANLPLIPEAHLPKQLWEMNPKKIIGLTNNASTLNTIRKERMRAYGLPENNSYSDIEKIRRELAFSNELYQKLGCVVINVASLSIEETASMIMNALHLEDHSYFLC